MKQFIKIERKMPHEGKGKTHGQSECGRPYQRLLNWLLYNWYIWDLGGTKDCYRSISCLSNIAQECNL